MLIVWQAFSDVSFIMPVACYKQPKMLELLTALPTFRDNSTDLGCYLQVTHRHHIGITCASHGRHINLTWASHRHRIGITWEWD